MVRTQLRCVLQEELGDPARGFGVTVGIVSEAAAVIKPAQNATQPPATTPAAPGRARIRGNLSAIPVTFQNEGLGMNCPGTARKFSPPGGSRTLVVGAESRYIRANF